MGDDALAGAHFRACDPYNDDPLPCTVSTGPAGTTTLMPLKCFQCGMLLNNKQTWYENCTAAEDPLPPLQRFTMLQLAECCRINLATAARDLRLHFDPPFTSSLVGIERAPRSLAPPTTLPADGRTHVYTRSECLT